MGRNQLAIEGVGSVLDAVVALYDIFAAGLIATIAIVGSGNARRVNVQPPVMEVLELYPKIRLLGFVPHLELDKVNVS
jgi:hypothetical protein